MCAKGGSDPTAEIQLKAQALVQLNINFTFKTQKYAVLSFHVSVYTVSVKCFGIRFANIIPCCHKNKQATISEVNFFSKSDTADPSSPSGNKSSMYYIKLSL